MLLSCDGCDGTTVNTGTKGGMCWLFELVTESHVQKFICQLHGNELNLRCLLLLNLNGTTTGPKYFSGPIGKTCAGEVWERDVVEFETQGVVCRGTCPICRLIVQQLSMDQQLLYLLASGC